MRAALSLLLVPMLLQGCESHGDTPPAANVRVAEFVTGDFRVLDDDVFVPALAGLHAHLDREQAILHLALADGSTLDLAYEARDREAWIPGCGTSSGYSLQEAADLPMSELHLGPYAWPHPVLRTLCASEVLMIVSGDPEEVDPLRLYELSVL